MPINLNDSNFIDSKSEQNAIFKVSDVELSIVCTTEPGYATDSALLYGEAEWTDMSLKDPSESEQEIEEYHLKYKEEQDVNYIIPVPKQGTPRDSSFISITIMVVDTMELNSNQGKWFYKNKIIRKFFCVPVPTQDTSSNLVQ